MRIYPLVFVSLVFFIVGCGGEKVVPVSGKIMLNKKPLADATVSFQPAAEKGNPGPGSTGKTDANGVYFLFLNTNQATKGAVVGKHKVSISAMEGEVEASNANPKPRVDKVPAEYNTNSALFFDVPSEGSTKADFDLNTTSAMPK
jgi:hypothetical protein